MSAMPPPYRTSARFSFMAKIAAGDVQTFENSLATIGRSFLSPKAPGLFKHEIGFQILDSDDDNTRAVGVFGFRVGKRLLYVPLFYRNGVVKGTEQLRDPKRKICVPLSDNWVNKFLSEQGDEPPQRIARTANKDHAQPSLWQLKYPPSKYASANFDDDATQEIRKDLARAINPKKAVCEYDLGVDLVKMAAAHPKLLTALGDLAVTYSWFGDALEKFHGREKIAAALTAAPAIPAIDLFAPVYDPRIVPPLPVIQKAASNDSLTIIRASTVRLRRVGLPGGPKVEALYDPEEWEDLRVGNNVYKDNRGPDLKSKVTVWVGGTMPDGETMSNPSEHGVYEVLGPGHEFVRCAVLTPLVGWGPSVGRCLVVRLDDGAWCYAHPNAVWVRGQADQGALGKWVEDLPTVKNTVDGFQRSGTYAAVARVTAAETAGGFAATIPFTKHDADSESVWPLAAPNRDRPFWGPFNPWEDRIDLYRGEAVTGHSCSNGPSIHDSSRDEHGDHSIEVFDECSQPVVHGRQLYLPTGCHLVKLDGKRFRPGSGSDPERVLFSRRYGVGDKKVELAKEAYNWVVTDPRTDASVKFANAADAEAYLVESHGFDVPDARKFMAAITPRQKQAAVLVAYAEPYKQAAHPDMGLAHNYPGAPSMPFDQVMAPASFADDIVPSETGLSASIPIEDMLMQSSAPDRYRPHPVGHGVQTRLPGIGNDDDNGNPTSAGPSSRDLQAVATSSGTGKRDLFDTASLATLVKYKRLDSLLHDTRGILGKAVTALGDDLAHLYWNTDEWSDRFGEGEIGPLEDRLRSQFEELGELALTLQEKAVEDGLDAGILPEMSPADNSEQSD